MSEKMTEFNPIEAMDRPEGNLLPDSYYDTYGRLDVDLSLMHALLPELKLPKETMESIKDKDRTHFLMLGSATVRNLWEVSKIDRFFRPDKVENDDVTIIDQNIRPLTKHKKEIDWIEGMGNDGWGSAPASTPEFPLPKFRVAQADMRQLPFAENSFDFTISDYTLNYLNNIEDIDRTFREIAQTLAPGGLLMVSVRGNEKHPFEGNETRDTPDEVQEIDRGSGVKIYCFPAATYIKIAQRHGLKLLEHKESPRDFYAVLAKSREVDK